MQPCPRRVHYYDTEQMPNVHHSNYIRWFEEARLDLMEQLGISYAGMEKDGILIPVVDVSCNYLQSVRYGDTVAITVTLTKFTGVRMEFSYEVRFTEDGRLASKGTSSHCFLLEGRPVSLKRCRPALYEKLCACSAQE